MLVTIRRLKSAEMDEAVLDQIKATYREVFRSAPYFENEENARLFAEYLPGYVWRDDFRCCLAEDEQANAITVVGFAYGYNTKPGTWWYDNIAAALDGEQINDWLRGAFEFAEFAVLPDWQGQGIGGCLHNFLLENLPHRTAVLTTLDTDIPAVRLYYRRGWEDLRRNFKGPGFDQPYRIMGKRLHS
jgi:GNAT superfamily N-acetyltransferase